MTQNIRFGNDYDCEPPVTLPQWGNCPSGSTLLGLRGAAGEVIVYRLGPGGTIQRSTGGASYLDLTDSSITILGVNFFVIPASPPPAAKYPRVLVRIKGRVGDVSKGTQKEFSVQTTVTKRNAIAQ